MALILVVEDETEIRTDIMDVLELEGFQVLGAADGLEGLELAMQQVPDLIVSDIMMPNMDGYQLLLKLQTYSKTASIPVLFLTAKADKQDIRKGMGLGADDYITKPFLHQDLLEAVKARLDRQARIVEGYQQTISELHSSLTRSLPHELRTPLNAILGYTSFLLEDIYSFDYDKMYEMVETVNQAGKRLEHLVENYLTYTQIELAYLKPDAIDKMRRYVVENPIYPAEIIEYIALEHAEHYKRVDDLILELDDIPAAIYEDDFKKIIRELVDNAFKFSSKGTPVQIKFYLNANHAMLIVTDEGRGMTAEQIEKVDAFRQFEREIHEQQGLGLGLIIAKGLLGIYNARFVIERNPKRGISVITTLANAT